MVKINFELLMENSFEEIYTIFLDLKLLWKLTTHLLCFDIGHLTLRDVR